MVPTAKRMKAAVFLLGLILVLYFPSTASSEGTNNPNPPIITPELLPESQMPDYFLKVGATPAFTSQAITQNWLATLVGLAGHIDGPRLHYWGTLVVAEGAGADGYYWIFIKSGLMASVNSSVVSSLESDLDSVSVSLGWVSNVPMKFADATGQQNFRASRTDPWRPIIGGIEVTTYGYFTCGLDYRKWSDTSTIGFAAEIGGTGGTKGYAIAGHTGLTCNSDPARVPVGSYTGQPTSNYDGGAVSRVARAYAYADVAFAHTAMWLHRSTLAASE